MQKKIGLWSSVAIITGSIIGSAVFVKPAAMAEQTGSPLWLSAVWIFAGIMSLFGALIYAELGAMMPETGGIYVYFRRMFGDFVAFLYGWAAFSVINTAAVAAIAYVFARYAGYFISLPQFDPVVAHSVSLHIPFIGDIFPLEDIGTKSLAAMLVILLTWLNARSIRAGSAFQVVSTIAKLAVIAGLVLGILLSGNGSFEHFTRAEQPRSGMALVTGIVMAMTGAFYAYDGWVNITFVAGEIRNPQKNIPRSLMAGMFICIAAYLLVNQAYLYALPVEKIAASPLVATDAMAAAWGSTSGAVIAGMIVICTSGAVNGNLMASARVTFAMGRDRVFWNWTGKEHRRHETPANALWLHCLWTCIFLFTGSFDMLADMFVFVTWIAYGAGAIGIFLLRKRVPVLERPYRIWGYPWVPILFSAFTSFYLCITLYNDIMGYLHHRQPVVNSLLGLVITAIGVPVYFYYRRKRSTKA